MNFRKKILGGPSTRVLFEHVPKCGGTSIWRFLQNQYAPGVTYHVSGKNPYADVKRFQSMSSRNQRKYRLVAGHAAHKLIPTVDNSFYKFTVLRDPIDRVISYYYYVKRRPDHLRHDEASKHLSTLRTYLEDSGDGFMNNNYIRRFTPIPYKDLSDDPEEIVELVFSSMTSKFQLIGILDELEELMLILQKQVKFHKPYDGTRKNVTEGRPQFQDIEPQTMELLKERNAMDLALYEKIKVYWKDNFQGLSNQHK